MKNSKEKNQLNEVDELEEEARTAVMSNELDKLYQNIFKKERFQQLDNLCAPTTVLAMELYYHLTGANGDLAKWSDQEIADLAKLLKLKLELWCDLPEPENILIKSLLITVLGRYEAEVSEIKPLSHLSSEQMDLAVVETFIDTVIVPIYSLREELISELVKENGDTHYFQAYEGTVYKVGPIGGKFVRFSTHGVTHTRYPWQDRGSLSIKEAEEFEFDVEHLKRKSRPKIKG